MTVTAAIDTLLALMQQYPDDRRYPVELQAHMEVRDGDPADESRYAHVQDRHTYREARMIARERLRIQGL